MNAAQKRTRAQLEAMPKPRNPAELEVLSAWYFGMPLHLEQLWVTDYKSCQAADGSAQYRVAEEYNDYHGEGWLHGKSCINGYDYSREFWAHVIGHLYCGGIATHSYGQATVIGRRNVLRLKAFEEFLLRKESGRLSARFERLARKHGAGENTVTRDSRVLTTGRVDGAVAASFAQRATGSAQ
jgi:hypothetical protein